jgi:hypothetical protein
MRTRITKRAAVAAPALLMALAAGCLNGDTASFSEDMEGARVELAHQQAERIAECEHAGGPWREIQVFQGGAGRVNKGETQAWKVDLQDGEARIRARVDGEWVYWFVVVSAEEEAMGSDGVLAFGPWGGEDCRLFSRQAGSYYLIVHNFGQGEWRGVLEQHP